MELVPLNGNVLWYLQAENVKSVIFISLLGVSPRELLVYKTCTDNCTFVYEAQMPPRAPYHLLRTNSFYFVLCCNNNHCNQGGPNNVERDILPDEAIEEVIDRALRLGVSGFFLSFACILVSRTLT